MPRHGDLANVAHQRRQRRYRERLRAAGRPEASAVDVAVAAAVAVYAVDVAEAAAGETSEAGAALRRIVKQAVRWLEYRGYSREEAKRAVRRRLGRFEFAPPILREPVTG